VVSPILRIMIGLLLEHSRRIIRMITVVMVTIIRGIRMLWTTRPLDCRLLGAIICRC
jgi:hypothetical protein